MTEERVKDAGSIVPRGTVPGCLLMTYALTPEERVVADTYRDLTENPGQWRRVSETHLKDVEALCNRCERVERKWYDAGDGDGEVLLARMVFVRAKVAPRRAEARRGKGKRRVSLSSGFLRRGEDGKGSTGRVVGPCCQRVLPKVSGEQLELVI